MLEFVGLYFLVQELSMKLKVGLRNGEFQVQVRKSALVPACLKRKAPDTRTRLPTHKVPNLHYIAW